MQAPASSTSTVVTAAETGPLTVVSSVSPDSDQPGLHLAADSSPLVTSEQRTVVEGKVEAQVAAISPLDKGVVAAPSVTGVEASVPPLLATPALPATAATAPVASELPKPSKPSPGQTDQALTDPLTGEPLAEDMLLAQVELEGDVPPPVRQNAGSYLDMDALSMLLVGSAIAGTALAFRDSSNDDEDNTPPIIVDPGPPIPEGPGTDPETPAPPVPPVTPEPPAAAPVTLFDPTEAIVEGFELDGPLVGVAETLQTVTESALTPLVGESFEPEQPGILDGTDGVLDQVVSVVPEDLLDTLGGAVDRPVPMDFNGLLLDQLDVVTDAATVLVVDNPISSVLGTATGPDSSPAGVLNFVDNLVSGEQLGTSVPPITSAAANLPGSLGAVLGSLGTV